MRRESSSAPGWALRNRAVETGGVPLHVREWGPAGGSPVLFWHGLGDHNGLQIGEAASILVDEFGCRVLGVDAPGFGGSPALTLERYDVEELAPLVPALLDGLGLTSAAYVGASWGAWVGALAAARWPERIAALALLDGAYREPRPEGGATLDELVEHWSQQPEFRFGSWDELLGDARDYFRRWSPQLEEAVRAAFREEGGEIVSIMGPAVYAAGIDGLRAWPPSRFLPNLAAAGVPVLLLFATDEVVRREEQAAALAHFQETLPDAVVQAVPNARHSLLEDQPEAVARALGAWLNRTGPGTWHRDAALSDGPSR